MAPEYNDSTQQHAAAAPDAGFDGGCIVVSLVWQQMPTVKEVQWVLVREGCGESRREGQSASPYQTARCAARGGDGAALC